jgi:hypothetical protein
MVYGVAQWMRPAANAPHNPYKTTIHSHSSSSLLLHSLEMAEADDQGGGPGAREQDRFLPIANISRIMKKALPNNAKIAKDAKDAIQECLSEFIGFITSE